MMTNERRQELEALADKDPHMCLLRELLNEIAELEARAVVVPEITPEDIDVGWNVHVDKNPFLGMADGDNDMDWIVETFAAGARHAEALLASRLRAIPSDRGLGERMVAVDQGEMDRRTWRDFAAGWAGARRSTPRQSSEEECAVRDGLASAWIDALHGVEALRANQGGIAT